MRIVRSHYQLDGREVSIAHLSQAVDLSDCWQQVHNQMVVCHVTGVVLEPLEIVLA